MAYIIANPIDIQLYFSGNGSAGPGSSTTVTFEGENIVYKCTGFDKLGNPEQGVINISLSLLGTILNQRVDAEPIEIILSQVGDGVEGEVINATPIPIIILPYSNDQSTEATRENWVHWSKIGSFDFTIDQSNVSGRRPMDWKGHVWEIKKLVNKVVAYGENGVSELIPSGVDWGMNTILRVGIKSKFAVAGTDEIHWFIDKNFRLWRLDQKLTLLDYAHTLSVMTTPYMFFDNKEQLLYVCDGTYGFIYNPINGSMCKGPAVITGIYEQDGTSYVTGSAALTNPVFSAITDIMDFGTRKNKDILNLELMTTFTKQISVKVHYRLDHVATFSTTPWFKFTPIGIAYARAFGVDFMFEFVSAELEVGAVINEIKINGIINGFSFLDTFSNR